MNNTIVVPRVYVQSDFNVADELWAIIILCIMILTRGIVASLLSYMKNDVIVPLEHHVHYSNEFTSADLKVKPKPPPRDELV